MCYNRQLPYRFDDQRGALADRANEVRARAFVYLPQPRRVDRRTGAMGESFNEAARRTGVSFSTLYGVLLRAGVEASGRNVRASLDPAVVDRVVAAWRLLGRDGPGRPKSDAPASKRTRAILARLVAGEGVTDIARACGVTYQAVQSVRRRWAK